VVESSDCSISLPELSSSESSSDPKLRFELKRLFESASASKTTSESLTSYLLLYYRDVSSKLLLLPDPFLHFCLIITYKVFLSSSTLFVRRLFTLPRPTSRLGFFKFFELYDKGCICPVDYFWNLQDFQAY